MKIYTKIVDEYLHVHGSATRTSLDCRIIISEMETEEGVPKDSLQFPTKRSE